MKKRLLALTLVLCMVVCLLPVSAAAAEEYEVIHLNEEMTLTLEYGEEKLYSFTPEVDGYYVFYTPYSEPVPGLDGEYYTGLPSLTVENESTETLWGMGYYGVGCPLSAEKTYMLSVANWIPVDEPRTYTVCIERNDPPTVVSLVQEITMVSGSSMDIEPQFDTNAKFITDVDVSSSDCNVVDACHERGSKSIIIKANAEGTATVTISLPNGASDSVQVTVKGLDPINLREERTTTLDAGSIAGYLFTPEESGEYVFVSNANGWADPETGTWYSGQLGVQIQTTSGGYLETKYVYNEYYSGVYCYMEAGQSYKLTAGNYNESGSVTGTILVDYYQKPRDLIWTYSLSDVWIGDKFELGFSCNEGYMHFNLDISWTSSAADIISIAENYGGGWCSLDANKPGTATITATLENGLSISQTITVHEAGVYTVIEGNDAVVPEGEGESLTVRADGHLAWFEGIKVDGKEVAEENYTATSGSTIIELHADYLATLAPGKHTLDICFKDGNATTSFTIEEAKPEVEFVGASLSLKGDIGLNFFAIIPDEIRLAENAVMRFTMGSTVKNVPLSQGTLDPSDGSYRYSVPLNAKNMGDDVTAQVYNAGGAVGDSKTLSIKYYADYVINNSSKETFVSLMKAMLNYGAAAQVNFGYDTENLVNADMAEADRTLPATLDVSAFAHSWTGEEEGLEITSASLLLQSETKIRIYFKLAEGKTLDDFTFTIDGVEVTPVQSGDEYYIEKANVAAKDLDTMYTFCLGNRRLEYCGLSYVNQVLTYSSDENLINLAKALYAYNQAANAYFSA